MEKMPKRFDDDYWDGDGNYEEFHSKDDKRYDDKRASIQIARKTKRKMKSSWMEEED